MSTAAKARQVLRCHRCRLNQFVTVSGNCRRCHKPYVEPEPIPAPIPVTTEIPPLRVASKSCGAPLRQATSIVLRVCRAASGLTQNEMARKFKCPRTYISKIENGHAFPGTERLAELAKFFGLNLYWLVTMIEGALECRAGVS